MTELAEECSRQDVAGPLDSPDDVSEPADPRVAAVMAVLAGEPLVRVASRWHVEPMVLERWVAAFTEAGTAQVTHRPVDAVARERDQFLTTFMHDLRSPLAMAQLWVGLLRDVSGEPELLPDMLEHLQDCLDLLDERALDVELLTAAMLGRLSMHPRRVDVADLVATFAPGAAVAGEGGGVPLHVDPSLASRILRDLWTAADTSRPEPHEVRIEVETTGPWVEVRVVRHGDPLDPAALHALFEPFDRAEDASRVTVGLYLARALTVVHGGTLGVLADDEHTVFWVRLPDARQAGDTLVSIGAGAKARPRIPADNGDAHPSPTAPARPVATR